VPTILCASTAVSNFYSFVAAYKAKVPIKYSCSSGSCGTCEQQIILTSGETRYVRPCMARVPRGEASIRVTKSDRYEPMM